MSGVETCVVIAARNAAATIAAAVASALGQDEVVEVVVVDDASTDGTASAVQAADDGSRRLKVFRLDVNRGPSHARNLAIAASTAPFISILDADDVFLPRRFAGLFRHSGWDLAADNIVFVREGSVEDLSAIEVPQFEAEPELVDAASFIAGNISTLRRPRGEMGFLKPVISRRFLKQQGLGYNEALRLGEDYELYARAMVCGARFVITKTCGYCAAVRSNSLSGRHGTEDLRALADADLALLAKDGLSPSVRAALRRHERHIRGKYRLRRFLDKKAEQGFGAALAYAFAGPYHFLPIVSGVAKDKLSVLFRRSGLATQGEPPAMRFLMAGGSSSERR